MIYKVRSGDSPYKIANKLGVTFAALIAANSQKKTTVIAGVRTWDRLLPDEELFVPVGSRDIKTTLQADTAPDVEATAAAALSVLNADPNHCVSVRHPGTPVNVAVHNFKRAWNASGQDIQLPISTGRYESIVSRALRVVMPHLPVPDGCDTNSHPRGVFVENDEDRVLADATGVGDDATGGTATGLPGNTITGGFGVPTPAGGSAKGEPDNTITGGFNTPSVPASVSTQDTSPAAMVQTGALVAVAATAAAALSADPNYCKSVGQTGSAVNSAVHAFKTAWNTAYPLKPLPVGTGKYEVTVAAALTTVLGGAGTAPDGCAATAKTAKHAHTAPPPPPPPPAAPAALPPAPAPVAVVPPPPVAPASGIAPSAGTPVGGSTTVVPPPPPPPPPPPVQQASVLPLPAAVQAVIAPPPPPAPVRPPPPGPRAPRPFAPPPPQSLRRPAPPSGRRRPEPPHRPHRHIPLPPNYSALQNAVPLAPTPVPPPPGMDTDDTDDTDTSAVAQPLSPPAAANVPPPPPDTSTPPDAGAAVPPPPDAAPPGKHAKGGLVPPVGDDKKKGGVSTGMLIAGGIGAVALIGIVAAAGHKTYRNRKSAKPAPAKESRR